MWHTLLHAPCNQCKWLVTLVVWLAWGSAAAGEAPCAGEPYRAFDFWLGNWQVTQADGQVAGHNTITVEQQGCVLVERWQGSQGGTGVSLNFYDPLAQQWRQVWVSPGVQIDIAGGMADGSMVLEGHIRYLAESRSVPFRGTWKALPDGRVRQYFEESREPGVWVPWFEGYYSREGMPPEG